MVSIAAYHIIAVIWVAKVLSVNEVPIQMDNLFPIRLLLLVLHQCTQLSERVPW